MDDPLLNLIATSQAIGIVKTFLEKEFADLDDYQKEAIWHMQHRFARFLPSPSKLNAMSVLKSNDTKKLTEWLFENEKRL